MPANDITDTRLGKERLQEALQGFEENHGIDAEVGEYRVLQARDAEDVLVVPRDTIVEEFEPAGARGEPGLEQAGERARTRISSDGSGSGAPTADPDEGIQALQAPIDRGDWSFHSHSCAARWYSTYQGRTSGFMDHCWYKYKLNESAAGSDYWAYHQRASFETSEYYYMDEATIKTGVRNPTNYEWFDWDPSSDRVGNCSDLPISISYGMTFTLQKCEEWDYNRSTLPGHLRNTWRHTGAGLGLRGTGRELGLIAAVRTAPGVVPTADFEWDMNTFFHYS